MSFADSMNFHITETQNKGRDLAKEIIKTTKVDGELNFVTSAELIEKQQQEAEKTKVFQQALDTYNKVTAEGVSDVWQIRYHVLYAMNHVLAEGANDSWSGRGNDHQRVLFDARRDAVKTVTNSLNSIE